ncbi:hypothetical protein [Pseudomonas sp. FP2338]|uniref:hypothetical protein n=1 Tax=Pseudomonas sp. FP2338 TaxID=2954093 RepID=UPI002734EF9B|nr:hypothetical protein [Pseudomonas sp. FP2338]WLH83551.1 hypothetical protein PSH96_22430 [Pseudomonas sp. FP2338]
MTGKKANASPKSKGRLTSTSFEGNISTDNVEYRQSRDVNLYGLQPTRNGGSIGIHILFPEGTTPGQILLPQPWPNVVEVRYFRQTADGQRTSYPSTTGQLFLTSYEADRQYAVGGFNFDAEVDGTVRSFNGTFDIRLV